MEKVIKAILAALTKRYNITDRTLSYTESTTIMPDGKFGGWLAINTGTGTAKVKGYPLAPGEGLDFRDYVKAGDVYKSPIQIEVPTGGEVRVTLLYAV